MENFNFICVLNLLGGLAFFLYGMHIMSASLEKIAGGKLESILRTITSSPLKGLLLGLGITAVIQSSSAVTVMLVGLVNSGLMKLSQAIGVIMGSNIGTTATAWILSLAGIESDNSWIALFKPDSLTPIMAFIGMLIFFIAKSNKSKNKENTNIIEYSLKLDSNPEFTASVLGAYARAILKMHERGDVGCKTVLDIAPADLSQMSDDELRKHLL